MAFSYNPDNIFARILRGELPADVALESEHCLAFHDIRPQAPVHLLLIPKGPYGCYAHFLAEASEAEILDFQTSIRRLLAQFALTEARGGAGYRLITNAGTDGFQEVPHLHMHILGQRFLGPLLPGTPSENR